MNIAIPRRPRTQALLDGTIRLTGLSARWLPASEPLGWALPPSEKHRDLASGEVDGGEMSISSFEQAKSRGVPLVALPIFLKRGLVQRSLFCSNVSPLSSPEQLVGKRVGLVSYTSSMAVWMRGVLKDCYGLASSSVQWFILSGSSPNAPISGTFRKNSPRRRYRLGRNWTGIFTNWTAGRHLSCRYWTEGRWTPSFLSRPDQGATIR